MNSASPTGAEDHPFRHALTRLGELAAHPSAFVIVPVYGAFWLLLGRESFDWHGVATLATWLMTFFITRTEYRDTQAIQAKLDELLLKQGEARSELAQIDEEEPEEIVAHRKASASRNSDM
jgi:low affinity Fe/Cu permease